MTRADRIKRLATLDAESLLSSVLAGGTWLCLGLIMASLLLQWSGVGQEDVDGCIHAHSLPSLIIADFRHLASPDTWPRLFLDLAIAVLMLTPYVRVLVSFVYSVWADRNRTHIIFMAFVLVVLAAIMFRDTVKCCG